MCICSVTSCYLILWDCVCEHVSRSESDGVTVIEHDTRGNSGENLKVCVCECLEAASVSSCGLLIPLIRDL